MFLGTLEYTIGNPIEKKLTKNWKYFARCPKKKEEI